jgi:hypothetical protein
MSIVWSRDYGWLQSLEGYLCFHRQVLIDEREEARTHYCLLKKLRQI